MAIFSIPVDIIQHSSSVDSHYPLYLSSDFQNSKPIGYINESSLYILPFNCFRLISLFTKLLISASEEDLLLKRFTNYLNSEWKDGLSSFLQTVPECQKTQINRILSKYNGD